MPRQTSPSDFSNQGFLSIDFHSYPQDDRVQLFKHLLSPKVRDMFEVDVDDVIRLAMDTSGYAIRDILDYYSKKLYTAIKKKS